MVAANNTQDIDRRSTLDGSLETVACDLCGRADEDFLFTKNGTLTGYPFRVVRCRHCGLIYLNPRLDEAALAGLYDKKYYAGQGFDPHVKYLADMESQKQEQGEALRDELTMIKELAPPPLAMLDFGCGPGGFMRQAADLGYSADGFELSPFAAELARAQGFTVFESLDRLPKNHYDLCTAIEVLEHCSSPMKTLRTIYGCLKPGGYLYYTTANFDGFHRKWRLGIKDPGLDRYIVPEGHIYFFSSRVMESYLKQIGFSEVFHFKNRNYVRSGRLYSLLSRLKLVNETADAPVSLLERVAYNWGRRVSTILGSRKRPLPLARK